MNWMSVLVLILVILNGILFTLFLKMFAKCKKIIFSAKYFSNYSLNLEQVLKKHKMIEMILLLLNASLRDNYEEFTMVYQKLYFSGIDKSILDNTEKLTDFLYKLTDDKIEIKEGEKPFAYKFIEVE